MGELSKDMVLKIDLGYVECDDMKILERLLHSAQNVTAFTFAEDGCLVVSVRPVKGEDELARALMATGLYPNVTSEITGVSNGGLNAC